MKLSNFRLLVAKLLLLWICCQSSSDYLVEAGKGKVPVYMPIPIPVPMPISGGAGGGKFSHHHQHEGNGKRANGDHGGEVKKIYLLQPIPKLDQQQQHHYNNQANQQQAFNQPPPAIVQQQQQHSIEQLQQSVAKSHSEMKILPIIVIPPMAPMPPIQLHQPAVSSKQALAPRMTLSPQFNNYLVSSGSEPIDKRSQFEFGSSYSPSYGGSVGGQLFRRERPRLRNRSMGPHLSSTARSMANFDYVPRSRVRIQEEFIGNSNDDYSDYTSGSLKPMAASRSMAAPVAARFGFSGSGKYRRRMQQPDFQQPSKPVANSIRDIMETQQQQHYEQQQSMFDDEPNNGLTDSLSDPRIVSESKQVQVSQHLRNYDSDLISSDQMTRDDRELGSSVVQFETKDYPSSEGDLATPSGRLSVRYSASNGPTGKRMFLDDREFMNDEDEWRFESVKSVKHVSPLVVTNSTTVAPTIGAANSTVLNS